MPRFFFHFHDGVDCPDPTGTDLPDWHAAQVEAIRLIGAMLTDRANRLRLGEDWTMEVTDEKGLVLFRLDFLIAGSAAVLGSEPSRVSRP